MKLKFTPVLLKEFPPHLGAKLAPGGEFDCDPRFATHIMKQYPGEFEILDDKEFQATDNKMCVKTAKFKSK